MQEEQLIMEEKKEMIPMTDKEKNFIKRRKFVTYAEKNLVLMMTIKNIIK